MTRVIHTGDTHVGYQQYHSTERRADFLRAFETVVDDAIDGDVDAVVHAGDLFHDRRPELPDLMGVLNALRELADADIPFLAVVGNHESTRHGEWLDLFEAMGLATRLGSDPVTIDDTAFYGLDWVPESRREDLEYDFADHDAAFAALVSHGLFTPFAHADWETETVLAEASVDFDAMLLGDNHTPDTTRIEGTWVTYCGSTERTSASEEDARGYNLVTFEESERETGDPEAAETGAGVDVRRRSLDTRPFRFVTVDLAEGEGVERVREQVRQHDLDDAVVIVEVTGDGEPITPAAVEGAATDAGALVVRVTDRREVEEASEVEVSFADPDSAVRERVAEMGLSPAAVEIDETVRESKVADTNVRETVKARVDDLLEGDATEAFRAADGGEESESAAGERTEAAATDDGQATSPDDEPADDDRAGSSHGGEGDQVSMGDFS